MKYLTMTRQPKYLDLLKNEKVRRWYENLNAKSYLTATTWLRTLGLYCELEKTSPDKILESMNKPDFRDKFADFVRKMEREGKAGSYIIRYKKVLRSFGRFNNKNVELNINIANDHLSPTIENERVPNKDELSRLLRKATSRGRVSISLMAFAGLRPESLGNYEGIDGLRLKDLKGLRLIENIEFEKIPVMVSVKSMLSKARHQYFSFLGEEGATYIKEYLEERRRQGEELDYESPLLQFDNKKAYARKNALLRTTLITRDIRDAIQGAGLKMRPYVLRAYFSTALDIAESKGLISHPWRQFIMGHKGDIEARYSTNKRLPPDMIEEMRESYRKCLKFLETRISDVSEDNAKLFLQQQLLSAVGYKQEEIDKIDLTNVSNEDFQQLLRDKVAGAMSDNGAKQKVIPVSDIEQYISDGYDFEAVLPNGKAVMRLRF
jgi:site-specific recombinase XerD